MFCNRCGRGNREGSEFCNRCGAILQDWADTQPGGEGAPVLQAAGVTPSAALHLPLQEAAPAAAAAARAAPVESSFDEEAWRAFLGPNADYYLPRMRMLAYGGPAPRWHWPAFLLSFFWLLYRKLWGWAFVYLLSPYLIALPVGFALGLLVPQAAARESLLALLVAGIYFVLPPLLANPLVYRHGVRMMARLQARTDAREAFLGALAAKGGTASAALLAAVLLAVVAGAGMVAAVAVPAYQDHAKRAQVAQAAAAARSAAIAVADHFHETREFPQRLGELRVPPVLPPVVAQVEISPADGELTLHLKSIGTLEVQPQENGDAVRCSSPDIPPKWLPPSCR